jgi:hypothetical protein
VPGSTAGRGVGAAFAGAPKEISVGKQEKEFS